MKSFKKSALSGVTCLHGVALAAALIGLTASQTAMAQDAIDSATLETAETTEDAAPIVVTGSRIARPNLDSSVPITSIQSDDFLKQGDTNVGDTLNDLPQLRSTFAQQNPGTGIGIAGLSLLDLRGLGTLRTLVLVNGRRHVPADILNNAVSPDVNTIPNDLIERVDIVTGGNSAVYGSDAIAGAVNFVLRRKFDGMQVRASTGIAEQGFGGNHYVSAMVGKNFADGAGNITLHGEYSHQDRVFASDSSWFRQADAFVTADVDSGLPTTAMGSDGFADTVFTRDVRSASINRFGLVPITQRNANPICGKGLSGTNGAPASTTGTAFNCVYIFTPDSQMIPQTGTRVGSGPNGNFIGGNGQTGREGQLLSVLPKLDRYNFNFLGHYEFSEAAELFLEAKWNRIDARGSASGPSSIQGQFTQFDYRERTRLDNPFLTSTQRTQIANAILASGCNVSLGTTCATPTRTTAAAVGDATLGTGGALDATDIGRVNDRTYRIVIARNLADSGIRDEAFQRDTYRIVGGLRGTFNDDWNYELSLNYGKFKEKTTTYGYTDRQRFMLAMDAGLDPADNQIKCRAKFDPASARTLQRVQYPSDPVAEAKFQAALAAKLATDIAACVPYNPFGGLDNSASAAYFVYNAHHQASLDQLIASGFVSGDTSGFFELPGGGPVRFAVGGEYRREKAYYKQDPFVESGMTNAVVIPTFDPAAFEVKEAFAELQLPVLIDQPFFREWTISGATRVAKYQGGTGTVWASNLGSEWSPFGGLRFRANYGRSVRAPNVSETGFPLVPNFANTFQDPCRPNRIAGNPTRTANCQADLGALLPNLTDTNYSLGIVSGSNPNLQAETSNSYTAGVVVQSALIPGLSISSDYYHITVNGIIASVSAQQIVDNCYDQPSLTNLFCASFERWRGPGNGSFGEIPGAIQFNTLVQAPLNYAKRVREGVDTQITYRANLSDGFKLYTNMIYTHSFTVSNYQDPTRPKLENRILEELGDPKDEFRWDVDLTYKQFTLGYRMRFIGPMFNGAYEDFNALPSACTTSGCPPFNTDAVDIVKYPSVIYHDLRFEWNIDNAGPAKDFQFYVGVDNLANKRPPLGSTATGAGSAIYDYRGRSFYAGARARF